MLSRTEPLYHQQASSPSPLVHEAPNPPNAQSMNGGILSIPSSSMEGVPDSLFLGDQEPSAALAPAPAPAPHIPFPDPPRPSQKYCPPSALEEANADDALRLPPLSPQSIISAPAPRTGMGCLDNIDTFIHTLYQELHHSPSASITCSVKQNDESGHVQDGPLEQRLEKKMNVQLKIVPPAANQRIKLPVPPATFTSGVSEPKPLFLSLVIAGETTRRIFGGVGLYHPNQTKSELVNIIEGSNFSPVVCITSGRTVCIGFKFTTYPRQCDPAEEAFRVMVTVHDCDGKLVAYSLSTSAYSVKSHPRNTKRSLQASLDDSEDAGSSRTKRRRRNSALTTTSTTSNPVNHTLPESSSAAASSNQQQFGGSPNIGGPPIVEPPVERSRGPAPIPVVDPRSQSFLQDPSVLLSLNTTEGSQPMPTLDEAVPASCSWRGGIVISLFVNNLPQDGPIYARFGETVVKTDRKTPHVLSCRVPAAPGPCEVDVTLSRGSGPYDAPYGRSLCKFIYEEDDITRMLRALRTEAQGPLWNAVTAIQEYASRNRLIPSQSYAHQSTYDQYLVPWPLTSYARLEVVEEEIEPENDAVQPETSNNGPNLEVTPHAPSVIMVDECGDATSCERGESMERSTGQDSKPLDIVPPDDPDDHTTHESISKPSVSPTPEPTEPVTHEYILNSPPPVMQHFQPAHPSPFDQAPSRNSGTSQQSLENVPPAHPRPPNQPTHPSPTGVWNPRITAQILPPGAVAAYEPPRTNVEDSAHGPALFMVPNSPPLKLPRSINLSHFYDDAVHPAYRNIHLKCHLKDPKDYQKNSKIIVRREKRVVLEMHLQADCERMRWKGIALPRTGSVKQPNQQAPTSLLYFSIEVHGSMTGMSLTQSCDNCWGREMRLLGNPHLQPHYLIDFKSDSPFILFPKAGIPPYFKAEVKFHFACYSNHQREDYILVAKLHDEQDNLVAYYQLPYSFKSVANHSRDRGAQDKYPFIVHPTVLSPAVTTATLESGSSGASHRTASSRSSYSQPPAPLEGQARTSIHYPVPPNLHPSQWGDVEGHPPSFGVSPRKNMQQLEASDHPLLQKVVPNEGPTQGGPKIVLIGQNFPPWPSVVYARFGSAVAPASWVNPFTLECILPPSQTGMVDVTLSLSLDHDPPMLGRSLCKFTYREEQESFLLMLRSIYSQGHELSRVALDILIPQVLQHASPESLNHALHRLAQGQDSLPLIDDRELEELGVRFLAAISDSPQWSNDLSFADGIRQTIAHLCVLSGYTRLLTKVVDWGIDLDLQDVNGLTALHFAYLREDWDCVQILKEAGADEYIEDNLGRTPRGMCQRVESEGTEREVGRSSSTEEEDWLDVPMLTSPGKLALLDAQMMPQLDWQNSSEITGDGICASPMPDLGFLNEDSFDDSWTQAFSNLQISESPPPLSRTLSSISSSPSWREHRPPRYGWSPRICPPSPMGGVQWDVSSGAPVRFHSLSSTSFNGIAPAFPIPEPAVLFPIPEPAVPFPLARQVHHFEPIALSFPPPLSPPPATPPFPVLGLASQVHHFEPVTPLFSPPSSPPPATPSFLVSGQTVPPFPPHHLDLVEPSFPILHPTIPPFAAPGQVLSFPVLERAAPTFPVLEPTSYVGDINEYYANSLSLSPSPQQGPPRRDLYPGSRYHTPAQTPHFHGPHATHSSSLLVFSRPPSPRSTRPSHPPPPSPRCDPPPSPPSSPPPSPPPHYGSSEGVAPSSPFEEGTAARRHQFLEVPFREATRTTWPSASQEKERQSIVYKVEQVAVTLAKGEGTVADAGDEPLQGED